MICTFCGVNWPATYAVTILFKSALERSGHSVAICEVGELDQIGRLILQQTEDVLLLAFRWMNPALITAIEAASGIPVICVETPTSALFSHWMEHTDNDPMAALRETSRDLAPLIDLLARIEKDGNLNVFNADLASDRDGTATFIADVLRHAPRPINLDFSSDADDIAWPDAAAFAPQPVENQDAAQMLLSLDANVAARSGQHIQIPIQLLYQPGFTPLDGSIDLTGSPRGLLFGPLIPLPPGAWTVTASLRCDGITQRPKLEFDAAQLVDGVHNVLGRSEFNLIADGRIKVSFTFVNPAPHHPLEFRLNLTQGVFHGDLTVEKLMVTPSSEATDNLTPSDEI